MMFRIPQSTLCRQILRPVVRHCQRNSEGLQKVKILSADDENFIKISFKYGNAPRSGNVLNIKVEKQQSVREVFQRIKLMVNLQRKKEEIRRSVISKYSGSSDVVEDVVEEEEDVSVALVKGDTVVDDDIKNSEAWTDGSLLKIGDSVFEIHRNTPSILQLNIPEYIVAGCIIRPHFLLECAVLEDCEFKWFRQVSGKEDIDDENNWVKVGEGFMYQTSAEDIGHLLKLVCIPKNGERAGTEFITVSKNEVEAGPDIFPFEERQQYTKDLADSDCVRCISYNVLANIYVEHRRFPYCSRKGRDNYYRKQLLLKEILGYNSDIICLQEVQERLFVHDLTPVLKKVDLEGFYSRKNGRRYEGVAAFYRTTKFKAINQQSVYLNEIVKEKEIFNDLLNKVSGNFKDMSKLLAQDTVLQLVLLQHLNQPKKKVLVANTHLYSNKDMPEVRLLQAALCTLYSEHVLKSLDDPESTALVFCGDFNSLPDSAAFQFIASGSFECCSTWKNSSTIGDIDMTLRHNLTLDSACGIPKYTNYTEGFQGCLDYIFYSKNNMNVSEVVPMPRHEKVTEHVALPSELFPSDHLPLICTLKWKTWDDNS